MKNLLLLLSASALLISCTEKGPAIDFGGLIEDFKDSTYLGAVETKEPHVVLVEEFTGATCPNCPAARDQLANIGAANPDRVIVIGYHVFGIPQSAPFADISLHDFRTQKGTDILNTVYGNVVGIPIAGIDRVPVNSALALTRDKWQQAIDGRIATAAPVNIALSSDYDAISGKAFIQVKVSYTEDVSFKHSLSLVVLENDIVDAQEFTSSTDTFYHFMHVFRDFITSTGGLNVLDSLSDKKAGRVYQAAFNYPVNAEWKPENCVIVGFIHRNDGTSKEIIQAAEIHLRQP